MNYINGKQNGDYYICNKCNNVVIEGTTSNEKVGK